MKLEEIYTNNPVIENRIEKINQFINDSNKHYLKRLPKTIVKKWNSFYENYRFNSERGNEDIVPDPLDFFNENELVYKMGHRKIIEVIPAIFVSLGILGTFVGIVAGISDIKVDAGVEGIQEGIKTLLSGMNFAFYSSIAGIVISIFYQLIDRLFCYGNLVRSTEGFINELDLTLPIESDSSFLDKIFKAQQSQIEDFREFFTNVLIPNLIDGISQSIRHTLEPHLEKSNQIMEKVTESTLESQADTLSEMVNHFVDSLNQVTGDHIKDLGEALHKTVEWQERVHEELTGLVDELRDVAINQAEMAKNTNELSEQMNHYVATLSDYQDNLSTSTEKLNTITESNTDLLQQINSVYTKMSNQYKEEELQFNNRLETMNQVVDKVTGLISETHSTTEQLESAMGQMHEYLDSNQRLSETLLEQHEYLVGWNTNANDMLDKLLENRSISAGIQDNLKELHEQIFNERLSLNNLHDQYSSIITESVNELNNHWKENNVVLNHNRNQFNSLNETLSQSMGEFADHMHRGVQNTFNQFDIELSKATNALGKGVESLEQIIESLALNLESIDNQLSQYNHIIGKLTDEAKVR